MTVNRKGRVRRSRARRLRFASVAISLVAIVTTGCGAYVESPEILPCRDSPSLPNTYGRISAQQLSSGGTITWGFYPSPQFQGTRYVVRVYMDGKRKDYKDQSYAPHGRIKADSVKAGKIFELRGWSYLGDDLLLQVGLQCIG
jgi:hypothetical protein